ncbi:MAG: hypothetical protein H8E90_03400 [Anaerolineales bacterium]|nr:hypothetical protein [Anaerolineales bacterium]
MATTTLASSAPPRSPPILRHPFDGAQGKAQDTALGGKWGRGAEDAADGLTLVTVELDRG